MVSEIRTKLIENKHEEFANLHVNDYFGFFKALGQLSDEEYAKCFSSKKKLNDFEDFKAGKLRIIYKSRYKTLLIKNKMTKEQAVAEIKK